MNQTALHIRSAKILKCRRLQHWRSMLWIHCKAERDPFAPKPT
uniref:Uncharacterized protein n=1 Tax=Rhizophora mucronata TaxID=61149 RepID=A0A2P2PBR9_RHIMU